MITLNYFVVSFLSPTFFAPQAPTLTPIIESSPRHARGEEETRNDIATYFHSWVRMRRPASPRAVLWLTALE